MREASRGFTVKFVQIYFDTVIKAGRTTAAGFLVPGPAYVSFLPDIPAAVAPVFLFLVPSCLSGNPRWRYVVPSSGSFSLFQRILFPSYRPLSAFFFVLFQEKSFY